MLDKIAANMNPQTVKIVKISAIAVGVVAGAVVTGLLLYKFGVIGNTTDVLEEVMDTAAQAA